MIPHDYKSKHMVGSWPGLRWFLDQNLGGKARSCFCVKQESTGMVYSQVFKLSISVILLERDRHNLLKEFTAALLQCSYCQYNSLMFCLIFCLFYLFHVQYGWYK